MPRGQTAVTGKWNFRVTRHLCPNCGKKGCYKSTESSGFKSGRTECYRCMYCRTTFKSTDIFKIK